MKKANRNSKQRRPRRVDREEARKPDEAQAKQFRAEFLLQPHVRSATAIWSFNREELDLVALVDALARESGAINEGKFERIEAMLFAQAHVLNAIFAKYASKMADADYVNKLQIYASIALKAQNLCRTTLTTIAEIKRPRAATFIKNSATNQQVNFARPEISQDRANELLENKRHERLDTRTTSAAGAIDQGMETMGPIDRAKDAPG